MTKNEIKKGDYIRVKGDSSIYEVLANATNVITYKDHVIYASSCKKSNAIKVDSKTAFLTRLGALLKEFDARIYDHDDYRLYIDLGIHREGFERIVYSDTEGEVNADNIMDFDKE